MSAADFLTEADRIRIEDAIREAETQTSAEIIVVLARRSGRYDRAEDIFGLILGLAAVMAATLIWPAPAEAGSWSTSLRPAFGLGPTLVIVAVAWALGAFLATKIPALARPFVLKRHMLEEVKRRGLELFHMFRLRRTAGATGVLIYASLFERIVWVCPDDEAGKHLDESGSAKVRNAALEGIKGGDPARGLAEAVRVAGVLLRGPLPAAEEDRDELPNTVHVVE